MKGQFRPCFDLTLDPLFAEEKAVIFVTIHNVKTNKKLLLLLLNRPPKPDQSTLPRSSSNHRIINNCYTSKYSSSLILSRHRSGSSWFSVVYIKAFDPCTLLLLQNQLQIGFVLLCLLVLVLEGIKSSGKRRVEAKQKVKKMVRTLDALLRRNFKASKFKTIVKLAVSRDAIMKNQRQARYSYARSDVIQLLTLGHHEEALLRVEYVITEENMLDVLVMIENYCHLLIERVMLFQKNKECPEELREAVSSLIFASSRCGEFPELLKIREMLTMRFGKEFAARAIELRNNSAVNPKIVQKLSSRRPSLESRLKVLKEISAEIGITLHLEEDVLAAVKEPKQQEPKESANFDDVKLGDDPQSFSMEFGLDEKLPESVKTREKYRDVGAAALDAFESAAYAAAAARAAIELSRSESQDYDSDDDGGSSHLHGACSESNLQSDKYAVREGDEGSSDGLDFDKNHPVDNLGSESGGKDLAENSDEIHLKELEENDRNAGGAFILKQYPGSESENDEEENEVASDKDDDTEKNEANRQWQTNNELDSNRKPSLPMITHEYNRVNNGDDHQCLAVEEINNKHSHPSEKLDSPETKECPMIKAMERKYRMTNTQGLNFRKQLHEQNSNTDWKQFSKRTIPAQRI